MSEQPERVITRVTRAGRVLAALVLGTLTAAVEMVFLLVAGPVLLVSLVHRRRGPAPARFVLLAAGGLAELEVRRLGLFGGPVVSERRGSRVIAYLAVRWLVGVLGGLVLFLLGLGAATAVTLVVGWSRGQNPDGIPPTPWIVAYLAIAGAVMLFLDIMGIVGVAALEVGIARRFLGPSSTEALERRVAELAESRAGIVAVVDQERRRIERDLHDGVQQRLVALALLIGRARRGRSQENLDDLLRQAQQEAQEALSELREVAWRIYPTGLDSLGLHDALSAVAGRAGVPVTVRYGLARRPAGMVETAAYFVVREAVTNAAKHSGAGEVVVEIEEEGEMIVVRVRDDGSGGADPSGGGLSGLARRVAALDGRLTVDSPPSGPTTITAEFPCG
ncbi:sensor histidine kinase [Planotetraspora kaengkrachanensis]|uniref:histidine kinase n=1 Tax=Planotetraspora kaengkrachanensis TaxID=575193 RepID=A0A8J3PQN7_9ACTN|nr:histidine kinase [Planotetraspora kaengkrachanensis]GIG78946.1 ATPase [Planotetraspora kaengkrachanensis]